MDSKHSIFQQILDVASNRHAKMIGIATLILTTLTILQVANFQQNAPTCQLLGNCTLDKDDLNKIQFALNQSGLTNFTVKENQIIVPQADQAEYLQAVAKQDAIPKQLQNEQPVQPSFNPLLSRRQQLAIERNEKKRLIQEMVTRLPFVSQAWFETDKSTSHSPFETARQSAVISIRTPDNMMLSEHHVDTVKRIIVGAIADLNPNNIEVIDLNAGFAHQHYADEETSKQVHFQRIATEQKRFYEHRIRHALHEYPGIEIEVLVEVKPQHEDQVTHDHTPLPPASDHLTAKRLPVTMPRPGANGYASIETIDPPATETVRVVSYSQPVASVPTNPAVKKNPTLEKQVSVSIGIPQSLVLDQMGNTANLFRSSSQTLINDQIQTQFEQIKREVVKITRRLLPESAFPTRGSFPITVSLLRQPLPETNDWTVAAQEFAIQNWPSGLVLMIGVMLLMIVMKKPKPSGQWDSVGDSNADILSLNSELTAEANVNRAKSDPRLAKLIENDPDAAARVIEAWIRDAA